MNEEQELDGGLVLRPAVEADHGQIVELSADAHGGADGLTVRELLRRREDPGDWLVVVDGDRVVSTCTLLEQTLRVGSVELPVGQVEYVATIPDHRRRGLVAALFAAQHRRSSERGHLVNLVYGIPYFYRRLGYGYGLEPGAMRVMRRPLPTPPTDWEARVATVDDLDAIEALDREARARADIALLRGSARWRWLLEHGQQWDTTVLVAERGGAVEAWARLQSWQQWDDDVAVIEEVGASSSSAAHAALAAAAARVPHLEIWLHDRPGTSASPAIRAASHLGEMFNAVYVRFPDPVATLDSLRPVLSSRLKGSSFAGESGQLDISLYNAGIRLHHEAGEVVAVEGIPGEEDPIEDQKVGVAPDALPALVLGRFDPLELERRHDDVSYGKDQALMATLFPRQVADVLDVF